MIDVPRETADRLRLLSDLVIAENIKQNLIARSTVKELWERHIVDSLQLLPHAIPGRWLDIGSGAGFPGLVVAIAEPEREVVLIEPRPLRAAFLADAVANLGLTRVAIVTARAEATPPQRAAVISARAVASLEALLTMGERHAAPDCRWLLPKGRRAAEELAAARMTWQGRFTLIHSITDPEASIVMAEDAARKAAK